jgi:hypothetical protein
MGRFYKRPFWPVFIVVGVAIASSATLAQTAAPATDAPAAAATDAPPAKAKVTKPRRKMAPSVVVTITNLRDVALTQLDAAPTGETQGKQIAGSLAPGKKATAKVAYGKSCMFDLHGAYADGSSTDFASVDLCKDKKINLVE